jgi:uncharacterized protein
MDIAPEFRVLANDQDVTAKMAERLKSLRLTDETGTTSDTTEISLADNDPDNPVDVPPTGAELKVFLGYDNAARFMGLYVCDEIELAGYPGEMVIRARAAPYEDTAAGKQNMQTQKTRSWPKGTTLGAMVNRIAGEHGLKAAISSELSAIKLPHTDQSHESDMNLLLRMAKRYDAVAKPAGGSLVFVRRGDAQSASGKDLPRITFTPADGSDYRVIESTRADAASVVAYYRENRTASRREVAIGDGEPVIRLRMAYADRVSAEAAAKAEHRRRTRGTKTMTYTFPGRPEVGAEGIAVMSGFRPGVDGEWLIKRAEHYVGPQGYRTTIECELANANPEVEQTGAALVTDTEQEAEEVDAEAG